MKRTFFLLTAVSALCAAAPAAAQYRNQYGLDTSFDARIGQLQSRLDAGIRAGTIDRREAWRLRREIGMLDRLERQYSYDGFSRAERIDLQQRLRAARQDLRLADNGGWDRNDRYGWNDNAYGRYTGRGGPEDDWLGLRIGQRATGDLVLVPGQYRMRYRDRDDVYYRSDGHMIYEIDARTNLVLNAYPAD
jgi:hypothetical protein